MKLGSFAWFSGLISRFPAQREAFEDISTNDTPEQSRSQALKIEDAMQKTSINGKIELAVHEGIVLERYKDSVGVWTIGVGVTAAAGADIDPRTYRGSITVRHAIDMMEQVLPKYEGYVRRLLDGRRVPQHVFDGLVCAAYNIGPNFANGRLTRKYVRRGEYRRALVLWRNADGKPSTAILKRRHKEALLIETGIYSQDPIPLYDGRGRANTPRRISEIPAVELKRMMKVRTV